MEHPVLIAYTELLRSARFALCALTCALTLPFVSLCRNGLVRTSKLRGAEGITPAQCSGQKLAGKPVIGHRKIGGKLEGLTEVLSFDNNSGK